MATSPEYSLTARHTHGLEVELGSITCSPLNIRSPWVHVPSSIPQMRLASKKTDLVGTVLPYRHCTPTAGLSRLALLSCLGRRRLIAATFSW